MLATDTPQSAEKLTESYARWRSSRLGRITDRLEQQLLFELLGSVAGNTLLDVGCGDGALASELARRGVIVTGLDADPAMVAAAQRRAEIEAIALQLVEGRAEELPFANAAFDRVVAVTMLCFVRDAQQAIMDRLSSQCQQSNRSGHIKERMTAWKPAPVHVESS